MLRAIQPKIEAKRRFVVIDSVSGIVLFNFDGEKVDSNHSFSKLTGICLLGKIDPQKLLFLTEIPSAESVAAKNSIEEIISSVRIHTPKVRLTRRETEVLRGVRQSMSNKELAHFLNLSERTVKFHVSSLLAKYGVRGRMELVTASLLLDTRETA